MNVLPDSADLLTFASNFSQWPVVLLHKKPFYNSLAIKKTSLIACHHVRVRGLSGNFWAEPARETLLQVFSGLHTPAVTLAC